MKTVIMQLRVPPGSLHPSMGPGPGLVDSGEQVPGTFENYCVTVLVAIDVRPLRKIFMNPDQVIDGAVIK
jgi:hypothetical protein